MIDKLDDTIPRETDPAPGTPGNTADEEAREVRSKINEIIEVVNKLTKEKP